MIVTMDKNICTVSWCEREARVELCDYHVSKRRQGKDPEECHPVRQYRDPVERFKARTEWDGDCLRWTGACNIRSGHGYFTSEKNGKKWNTYAHRYAWELANGPIPEGVLIDHSCRNPWCVNVEHLRFADKSTNGQNVKGARRDSTTGVRNVQWNKQREKYQVRVNLNGKAYHGGFFDDLDEAAEAASALRKQLFGEFAGEG